MKSGQREVLKETLKQTQEFTNEVKDAIENDLPWRARFLLDLLLGTLRTVREYVQDQEE